MNTLDTKQCSSCSSWFPVGEYNTHSNGKPRAQCNSCVRGKHYERKYGITHKEYDQMYLEQNGVCKICKLPPVGQKNRLCVDHDHQTGDVRALLCDHCNRGLGFFKDDERLLNLASDYIRTFKR
jgi:hypothetical protein